MRSTGANAPSPSAHDPLPTGAIANVPLKKRKHKENSEKRRNKSTSEVLEVQADKEPAKKKWLNNKQNSSKEVTGKISNDTVSHATNEKIKEPKRRKKLRKSKSNMKLKTEPATVNKEVEPLDISSKTSATDTSENQSMEKMNVAKKRKEFRKGNKYLHLVVRKYPDKAVAKGFLSSVNEATTWTKANLKKPDQQEVLSEDESTQVAEKKRKKKHSAVSTDSAKTEKKKGKKRKNLEEVSNDGDATDSAKKSKRRKRSGKSCSGNGINDELGLSSVVLQASENICDSSNSMCTRKSKKLKNDATNTNTNISKKSRKKTKCSDTQNEIILTYPADNDTATGLNIEPELTKQKKYNANASDPCAIKERCELLKGKMSDRLKSSQFRYLNEQLYTCTGNDAYAMFKADPDSFHVYHEGFQTQVSKWPVNPLQIIINDIKARSQHAVIIDFGCGDATLARSVSDHNTVHSFDLAAINEQVTVCDMVNVPLTNASVDIAVFCLSLMGTNLVDYLKEAHRVLKRGGILKIAEVKSRFNSTKRFVQTIERLGFTLQAEDLDNDMFVLFDFKKTGQLHVNREYKVKLMPCLYKKR